ncbi:uncharacterized protein [Vulpes vulpes]|uniref:Uncharacterized protein n=1 Tax=Vulpes vulpes TaxID=9627 RepID=A0ABM4XAA8_VULVU
MARPHRPFRQGPGLPGAAGEAGDPERGGRGFGRRGRPLGRGSSWGGPGACAPPRRAVGRGRDPNPRLPEDAASAGAPPGPEAAAARAALHRPPPPSGPREPRTAPLPREQRRARMPVPWPSGVSVRTEPRTTAAGGLELAWPPLRVQEPRGRGVQAVPQEVLQVVLQVRPTAEAPASPGTQVLQVVVQVRPTAEAPSELGYPGAAGGAAGLSAKSSLG